MKNKEILFSLGAFAASCLFVCLFQAVYLRVNFDFFLISFFYFLSFSFERQPVQPSTRYPSVFAVGRPAGWSTAPPLSVEPIFSVE